MHRGVRERGNQRSGDGHARRRAVFRDRPLRDMDMDILCLIKIVFNPVCFPVGADKADCGARGLLHHISERASQLDLAAPIKDRHFHL